MPNDLTPEEIEAIRSGVQNAKAETGEYRKFLRFNTGQVEDLLDTLADRDATIKMLNGAIAENGNRLSARDAEIARLRIEKDDLEIKFEVSYMQVRVLQAELARLRETANKLVAAAFPDKFDPDEIVDININDWNRFVNTLTPEATP